MQLDESGSKQAITEAVSANASASVLTIDSMHLQVLATAERIEARYLEVYGKPFRLDSVDDYRSIIELDAITTILELQRWVIEKGIAALHAGNEVCDWADPRGCFYNVAYRLLCNSIEREGFMPSLQGKERTSFFTGFFGRTFYRGGPAEFGFRAAKLRNLLLERGCDLYCFEEFERLEAKWQSILDIHNAKGGMDIRYANAQLRDAFGNPVWGIGHVFLSFRELDPSEGILKRLVMLYERRAQAASSTSSDTG